MDARGWKSLGVAVLKIAVSCALAVGIPYGAYAVYCHYAQAGAFLPKIIDIQGNLRQSDASILDASGISPEDTNLAETDIRTVEESIETLPWVKKARVTVRLPDTVRFQITEFEPLGIVNDGTLALVDTDGSFIKYWRDEDELTAPIVSIDKPLADRTKEVMRAFEIAASAHKLGYDKKIHEIQYDSGIGYTIYTGSGEIRLGYDRFEERIKRLIQVESELESRHVIARYILLDTDDDLNRVVVRPESAQPKADPIPAVPPSKQTQIRPADAREPLPAETQSAKTPDAGAKNGQNDNPDNATEADASPSDAPNLTDAPRERDNAVSDTATRAIPDDEDLALPPGEL